MLNLAHADHIAGTYHGKVLTTLGFREVTLTIAPNPLVDASVCFRSAKKNVDICTSIKLEGNIIQFDCTSNEYDRIVQELFSKKWPNHTLLYDPINGSVQWRVGWGEYTFLRIGRRSRTITESMTATGIDERITDWYCVSHDRFSYLRLGNENDSRTLQLNYRRAYSFPWSHRTVKFEASKHGAVYWFDHTTSEVSEVMSIVAGKPEVEFVHLMESPDRMRMLLSVPNVPTLVFSKC